jgi:signal transduction histidine kinase
LALDLIHDLRSVLKFKRDPDETECAVRPNQSLTANAKYSNLGALTLQPGVDGLRTSRDHRGRDLNRCDVSPDRSRPDDAGAAGTGLEIVSSSRRSRPAPEGFSCDGLLHDARNLVSAIGLYCDLLSIPGVLKQEHLKYPAELRHLGIRSQQMIEHLMDFLTDREDSERDANLIGQAGDSRFRDDSRFSDEDRAASRAKTLEGSDRLEPISLRSVVERCTGLLSRVANGRAIQVAYGPAADIPVRIEPESVERILVNLVRNGSAALAERDSAIRISVGALSSAVGEAQPWPFQRVRLVVEDSGCGMDSRQLGALLSGRGPAPRGNHGIGFRVVRELVDASNGELRAASSRGIGTRIQVEWPMAEMAASGRDNIAITSEPALRVEANSARVRTSARAAEAIGYTDSVVLEERQGAC